MKLIILLCLLVHTNAYRAPLPYGTGVASRAQGIGDPGILDLIWNWFADDNSVQQMQGNLMNNMSKNYSAQFYAFSSRGSSLNWRYITNSHNLLEWVIKEQKKSSN